jgi:hypothetical protein
MRYFMTMFRTVCRSVWIVPTLTGLIFGMSMNSAMGQDIVGVVAQTDPGMVQKVLEGGGWPAACVLSVIIIARTIRDLATEFLKTGVLMRHEVSLSKSNLAVLRKIAEDEDN